MESCGLAFLKLPAVRLGPLTCAHAFGELPGLQEEPQIAAFLTLHSCHSVAGHRSYNWSTGGGCVGDLSSPLSGQREGISSVLSPDLPSISRVLFLTLPSSSPSPFPLADLSPCLNHLTARKSPSLDLFKVLLGVYSSLTTSCPWTEDQSVNLFREARRALVYCNTARGCHLCCLSSVHARLPLKTSEQKSTTHSGLPGSTQEAKDSLLQPPSHHHREVDDHVFHLPGSRSLHTGDSRAFC